MDSINNIGDIYKLGPMQQDALSYSACPEFSDVEQTSCLSENLNASAFKRARRQVVQWHPSLRTSFYWQDLSEPLQVVHSQVTLPWIQEDWRGGIGGGTARAVGGLPGFELSQAPLSRHSHSGSGLSTVAASGL
jgi:hypothetical protein